MEREYLNKFGRPLLGATIKPKLGLSARNYGRVVYEALRGGLDFTKDDENINSQPFMRWRDRFLFAMEAVNRAAAETGEVKGHYLNVTAGDDGGDVRARRVRARSSAASIVMIDLTVGYTAMQSMSKWARAQRRCCCTCTAPATAPTRGRRPTASLPRDRQVVPAARRRPHPRRHRRRQARGRPAARSRGYYDVCRERYNARQPRRPGSTSTRTGPRCPASCRSPRAASTPARCTSCCTTSARTSILQFGGGTIGHPMGIAAGATANRVAVEAMIQARNEGRDYYDEGPDILAQAAQGLPASSTPRSRSGRTSRSTTSPPTRPTSLVTPDAELGGADMRITQGTFSFLPDLTDEQIAAQLRYALRNGWPISVEHTDDPHPRNALWEMWGLPHVRPRRATTSTSRMREVRAAARRFPNHYVKVVAYDRSLGRQTTALSFIVGRPADEPGFRLDRTETARPPIRYTLHAYATASRSAALPVNGHRDGARRSSAADERAPSRDGSSCRARPRAGRARAGQDADPRDRGAARRRPAAARGRARRRAAVAAHGFTGNPGHRQDDGRAADGRDPAPARLHREAAAWSSVTRDDLVGPVRRAHRAEDQGGAQARATAACCSSTRPTTCYRPENERDYGQEAIEILLQVMETERDRLVVDPRRLPDRMERSSAPTPAWARASRTTSTSPTTTSTS